MPTKSTTLRVSLPVLVIGLIFAAANMRSPLVMIGSIVPMLEQDFGLTAAQIGYLGAIPMPLFAFGSLVAATLARRFGLEVMVILMTVLLTFGVLMRSWFGVSALFVGTLILSFAIGMLNALTAPFIKQYAPNHISVATGVFSLSMSALAGIGAWVVIPLSSGFGWQLAMSGWAVFGAVATLIWCYIYLKYRTPSQAVVGSVPVALNPWKQKAAWQMAVLLGLQSFLFYTIASFLPSIGMGFGATLDQATQVALVFQLMAPPAIMLLTWLMRRGVATKMLALIGCLMNAAGAVGMLLMPTQLMLWSALMGFGCAMIFTLSLMMFSLRTSSAEAARDLSSMVQAVSYSIALFGPLAIGRLYQWQGDWQLPLMVLAALMLVNIPFGIWAASDDKIDTN
ncbi:MFS transporter [Moraxella marmotae]|uniref:MFS transporter n=1 Tax=Moraxella marmotae TaxID=3344520 RepID=UPI0035F4B736